MREWYFVTYFEDHLSFLNSFSFFFSNVYGSIDLITKKDLKNSENY